MKKSIIISIISGSLFFLFGSEAIPERFQLQEALSAANNKDVIIIFNSGGWGNTPFEQEDDFAPIIKWVEGTLDQWGYRSVVIPYNRVKSDFSGKVVGAKEFFNSFQYSADNLSKEIEFFGSAMSFSANL